MMKSGTAPEFEENCQFIARTLRKKYGAKVVRILLAGSQAKGFFETANDWDVIVILSDERTRPGPMRMDEKFTALDGRPVEYFRMSEEDYQRYKEIGNRLICETDALSIEL
jgi:predicted nucleotidyltransferase